MTKDTQITKSAFGLLEQLVAGGLMALFGFVLYISMTVSAIEQQLVGIASERSATIKEMDYRRVWMDQTDARLNRLEVAINALEVEFHTKTQDQ